MKGETRNSYPFETKMSAVKAHVEDGMTSAEAMKAYGIKSKSAFFRWCATYRGEGGGFPQASQEGAPSQEEAVACSSKRIAPIPGAAKKAPCGAFFFMRTWETARPPPPSL